MINKPAKPKVTYMRHLVGDIYEAAGAANETLYQLLKDGREMFYEHQSGYGAYREEQVRVVPAWQWWPIHIFKRVRIARYSCKFLWRRRAVFVV